jgi:hypothetical protein
VTPQTENGTVCIEQELNLGVLPVEIEFRAGKPFRVTMTQGKFAPARLFQMKPT